MLASSDLWFWDSDPDLDTTKYAMDQMDYSPNLKTNNACSELGLRINMYKNNQSWRER